MASLESFQLPTLKQLIAHQSHINSDEKDTQLPLPPLPLISTGGFPKYKEEEEEVLDIPIQILDDSDKLQNQNNRLLLRIPQKNFDRTIFHTVLKIRIIDPKDLEKSDNSRLKDNISETNLLNNDVSKKKTGGEILESELQIENEKLHELDRSAATYRRRRPRIEFIEQNLPIEQDNMSVTIMNNEESLPTNENNERTRRRPIRPNSEDVEVIRNHRIRPGRRRHKIQNADTTTISITTSRGSTLPDTTHHPRGFFLTKSTEGTLTTDDDETFVGFQSTESSNNHTDSPSDDNVNLNTEVSPIFEIPSGDGKFHSDNGNETFSFMSVSDENISSDIGIYPNLESISSDSETQSSKAEANEEIIPSTEESYISNTDEEFSSIGQMINGGTVNTDQTVLTTTEETNSDETYSGGTVNTDQTVSTTTKETYADDSDRDSLPEGKDDDDGKINFPTNSEVTTINDYLDYNEKSQDEMNFFLNTSEVPQSSENPIRRTTTKVSDFEDINSTPTMVTKPITSSRRHIRKKIIKRKPIPKELSNQENFNSSKGIRLKKITEKFPKDTNSLGNFESSVNLNSPTKYDPSVNSDSLEKSELTGNLEYSTDDSKSVDSEFAMIPTIPDSATFPIFDSTSAVTIDSAINSFTDSPSTLESSTNESEYEITEMDNKRQKIETVGKSHLEHEYSTEIPDSTTSTLVLDRKIEQNKTDEFDFKYNRSLINDQNQESLNINKRITDKIILKTPKPGHERRRVIKRKRIEQKNGDLKEKTEDQKNLKGSDKSNLETETNLRDKSKTETITTLNRSESVTSSPANPSVTRKRVVIQRGTKRFSTVTKPSTTTVQSFSVTGDHQNQITSRQRMRTVVRKRPKVGSHDTMKDEEPINRKGKKLSLNPELKIVEDAEEAGSEVNSYRTSSDSLRRTGSLYREPNRSRVRTTTHQPLSSIHPGLRRFTSSGRQTQHIQEMTLPSQLNYASGDDAAAAYLEHLARLEDEKAEIDDQVNRAHELVLENLETTTESGNSPIGTTYWRKISTTEEPKTLVTITTDIPAIRRRQGQKYFNKIVTQNLTQRPRRPAIIDYDYYEDEEIRFVGKPRLNGKLYVTSRGQINCLDQGNFPHPTSCRKFITCARMVNGQVIGTEYTCPNKLSFDPIGGICNWSAGLGCKE